VAKIEVEKKRSRGFTNKPRKEGKEKNLDLKKKKKKEKKSENKRKN